MPAPRRPLLASAFFIPQTDVPAAADAGDDKLLSPSRRRRTKVDGASDFSETTTTAEQLFRYHEPFAVRANHGGNAEWPFSSPLKVRMLTRPIELDASDLVSEEAGKSPGPHAYASPFARSMSNLKPRRIWQSDEETAEYEEKRGVLESREKEEAVIERRRMLKERRDVLSEVALTNKGLVHLGVAAGTWVEVRNAATDTTVLARTRLLVENGHEDDCIFLPPSLHFNLGFLCQSITSSSPSTNCDGYVRLRRFRPPNSPLAFHHFSAGLEALPVAKRVIIARSRSSGPRNYDKGLMLFFKGIHVLSQGHVFAVPTNPIASQSSTIGNWLDPAPLVGFRDDDVDEEDDDDSNDEDAGGDGSDDEDAVLRGLPQLVFFKVLAVEPAGMPYFRVDPAITVLEQQGSVHTRVPYFLADFLSAKRGARAALFPGLEDPRQDLLAKLDPFLHPIASALMLTSAVLLNGARRSGKRALVREVAKGMGVHLLERNTYQLLGGTKQETEKNLRQAFAAAREIAPAILHLRRLGAVKDQQSSQQKSDPSAVGFGLRDLVLEANRHADAPVLLVASCDDLARVPAELRAVFTHTVGMGEVPDLTCRTRLFEHFMAGVSADPGLSKTLALKTAGLTAGDINGVVADAGRYAVVRTQPGAARGERKVVSNASERTGLQGQKGKTIRASLDSILRGRAEWNRKAKVVKKMTAIEFSSSDDDDDAKEKDTLKTEDFESALDVLTERLSHQSGTSTAKIPDVKWDDVGGLENVKAEILDTIELPLKNPELFASGMRQRSGILLYGPPGTGKTLIAKAVASECSLNFISVKGPELLNMYIGESEKNVREVFERARACKPCVLFFDEIDSLAPARGQGSDSGGVMDRVVSQLLTELDGMNSNQDVFLIAATNRPDLLDSALLRPGRLDRCVYLGVSSTNEAQLNVVQALSRKFNLSEDCDLMQVVEKCPFTFSGADMYALCSDAMLNALKRKMEALEVIVDELRVKGRAQSGEEGAVLAGVSGRDVLEAMTDDEIRVEVTMADWMAAKDALTPSLSQDELDHYKQLQSQFSGDRKL